MRAGPKPAVDGSPLPLRGSRRRELAIARFASDYIRMPRGHGDRKPLRLRPWQRALITATWDQWLQPRVDDRRRQVGLEPLADYHRRFEELHLEGDEDEAAT
jgi:hypothetical protein